MECPLCSLALPAGSPEFFKDKFRSYFHCSACSLVFVPTEYHISEEAELAYYAKHKNGPEHEGYRKFLSRAVVPFQEFVCRECGGYNVPLSGLDFGCGSSPTLHLLLGEHGHKTSLYDKYYFPDASLLDVATSQYDFITATSVVGHLSQCGRELDRLWGLLKRGGFLVVMTKRWESLERFARWHYRTDPTHIMFFHATTFEWLRKKWDAREMIVSGADVVIFVKA